MFQRRASQKPNDEFFKNFKANFASLNQNALPTSSAPADAESAAQALDAPMTTRHDSLPNDELKTAEPTPRASMEQWNFGSSGFTPGLFDPSGQSFNAFGGQMPGYYTPTPGGTTLYHHQAGDLHTPNFSLGLNTPLSLSTSEGTLHAGHQIATLPNFHHHHHMPQHDHQQAFQNVNMFQMQQSQAYPPQQFSNQAHFDRADAQAGAGESPLGDNDIHVLEQSGSPELLFQQTSFKGSMPPPPAYPSSEKYDPVAQRIRTERDLLTPDSFRFHTTLNAPTAMIKHSDEIPITYLNKGQAYTLTVKDSAPLPADPTVPIRYRTFVRVSFEDEEQRQKPATCWQLWKEGRGTNEAHQRAGRLQAVEFVDTSQPSGAEDPSKPVIDLESYSFDGFCVQWTPGMGSLECPISVRFNFLSTDFSHSKGVKGIPVRLCSKTERLSDPVTSAVQAPEVCYCKVKLFRDHGAERKLSNDVAHVKKTMDKLNQQIAQVESQMESGLKEFGKRKRSGSMARDLNRRPGKMFKHKRSWSTASMGYNGSGSVQDDLHAKLVDLQDMFSSTRPASVLYLRGAEQDDPDLHPVKLPGEASTLARNDSGETSGWDRQSSYTGPPSTGLSPTPSSKSLSGSRHEAGMQQPTPLGPSSRMNSNEWRANPQTALQDLQPTAPHQLASPPDNNPIKVKTADMKDMSDLDWIEAVGVDHAYQAPPDRKMKPVGCCYILPQAGEKPPANKIYRAVYFMQRTLQEFTNAAALKCNIEPTQVQRVLHITKGGLTVLFDDECVRELSEGQEMTVEICETQLDPTPKPKREWDAGPTDIQCDGDIPTIADVSTLGYELKLHF